MRDRTDGPAPDADQALPRRRSAALDGLRGYAAAAVVIYHATTGPDDDLVASILNRSVLDQSEPGRIVLKIVLSAFSGEAAVAMFFVISGIVLLRSLHAMLARSGGLARVAQAFLLRRVVRLWPILAAVLSVHVVAFGWIDRFWPGHLPRFTAGDFLTNVTLLGFPVNTATWTLRWEAVGAPLILLWFLARHRLGAGALPAALAAVLAVAWSMPSLRHDPPLATTLPFLAAGMAIESGAFRPVARFMRTPLALAAAAAVFATELLVPPTASGAWRHLLALLVSVTVLVAVLEGEAPGPVTSALLARPSQFLGRISFSLYLWNVPVLELLFAGLVALAGADFPHRHPVGSGLVLGVTAVLLTLPIAAASERWLEQACIRVGRGLTRLPARGCPRQAR